MSLGFGYGIMRHYAFKNICIFKTFLIIFFTTFASVSSVFSDDGKVSDRQKTKQETDIISLIFGGAIYRSLKLRSDTFSGVDVTGSSYFGYFGGTWTDKDGIDQPGWRLRVAGGTGRYYYDGNVEIADQKIPTRFLGEVASFDVMAGYQLHYKSVVVKGFVGANYTEHLISPDDTSNNVQGTAWGIKTQVELWWTIHKDRWLAVDASYASSFGDFWSKIQYGYDLNNWLSLGPEVGILGHQDYATARAGAFARFKTDYGDIAISGGATGNYEDDASAYGSLSFYQKF